MRAFDRWSCLLDVFFLVFVQLLALQRVHFVTFLRLKLVVVVPRIDLLAGEVSENLDRLASQVEVFVKKHVD